MCSKFDHPPTLSLNSNSLELMYIGQLLDVHVYQLAKSYDKSFCLHSSDIAVACYINSIVFT